jgi:hypothetical protein
VPDDRDPTGAPRRRTRRRLLPAAAGAVESVGTLAGCLAAPRADGSDVETGSTATTDAGTLASNGIHRTVCREEIRPDPNVPAIVGPTFATGWSGVDTGDHGTLDADTPVVGVERDGEARACPVPLSSCHEIVNDTFGGPLLVTFCPLCNSGPVAERRVDDTATTFHVSGLLWKAPRVQSAAVEERGDVFGVNGIDPDAEVRNSGNPRHVRRPRGELLEPDLGTGDLWTAGRRGTAPGAGANDHLGRVAPRPRDASAAVATDFETDGR